jgi:hypothetical protein
MHESNQTARIICNDRKLADQLRHQLALIAPDCEVLSAPGHCSEALSCRWPGETQLTPAWWLRAALLDATEVLERTRHSFKSRELGQLRQRLNALLDKLSDTPE